MTVQELIDILSAIHRDAEVVMADEWDELSSNLSVNYAVSTNQVHIGIPFNPDKYSGEQS